EYIQSFSRVGRKLMGLIFVWFYPNRVRDLSYYQNFELYHGMLEHRVERTPLSRWAKLGFKETINSIFCASILNYYSNVVERPLYKVEDVNEVFEDAFARNALIEFVKKAYLTGMAHPGAQEFASWIPDEVEDRLTKLHAYGGSHMNFFPQALADQEGMYYKTQYGMRGIQPEVKMKLTNNYSDFVKKYTGED
ncbi:MAG: hypothetical protein Q6365_002275, partial [Candidatus Sigynarchaeota archaeon]